MNFGNIIFMASLIGGEIMRWLEKNWKIVILTLLSTALVFWVF